METEIVSIGNEILMGMSENSVVPFVARECTRYGYHVIYQTAVGEELERIKRAMERALKRAQIIFVLIKPNTDTVIKEAIAHIWNNVSMQSDFYYEKDGNYILLLPAKKEQLEPIFHDRVLPVLQEWTDRPVYSKIFKFASLSENDVKAKIRDLMTKETEQEAISLRVMTHVFETWLMLSSYASTTQEAKNNAKPILKELKKRFENKYFTIKEEESLEESVVKLLWKHKLSFVTAESCTGGMIASAVINVPGASDALKESFVTYSNKAKRKYLDVNKDTLSKYTEYSEKCAKEMALGAALRTNSDVSVSTSGIAGPGGGTKEKPVGLVYIACSAKEKVTVKEFLFSGSREEVRRQACIQALELVRSCILERY